MISRFKKLLCAISILRPRRDAPTKLDVEILAVIDICGNQIERRQVAQHDRRFGGSSVIEQQYEFIATITRGRVRLPQVAPQDLADVRQHLVPDRVSVGVVDGLETVEVYAHHAEGTLRA